MNTRAIQWIPIQSVHCQECARNTENTRAISRIHAQYREASRSRNRWVPWGLTTATITEPQNRQLSRLFQILGRTGNYRNYFRSLPLNREFLHRSTMSWQQIVNRYLWWWLVTCVTVMIEWGKEKYPKCCRVQSATSISSDDDVIGNFFLWLTISSPPPMVDKGLTRVRAGHWTELSQQNNFSATSLSSVHTHNWLNWTVSLRNTVQLHCFTRGQLMHMSLSKRNTVQEDNLLCTRCSAKSNTEREGEREIGRVPGGTRPPLGSLLFTCSTALHCASLALLLGGVWVGVAEWLVLMLALGVPFLPYWDSRERVGI